MNVLDMVNHITAGCRKAGLGTIIEALITYLNYHVSSKAGLAIGTGVNTRVKVVNATDYVMAGVKLQLAAAQEEAFTPTDHDIADGYTAIFNLSVDVAGATTLTKGTEVLAGVTPVAPATPANELCVGTIQISPLTAIFNASTDALNAGHLTVAYVDRDGYIAVFASLASRTLPG